MDIHNSTNPTPTEIEGMSYNEYVKTIETLLLSEKFSTTDTRQDPDMLHYTEMNLTRMSRIEKTTKLLHGTIDRLEEIETPVTWLVLTEGWCGDAAQIVPVLELMAAENDLINLRLIFRDEHLDVMDAFLTNGGRAIPKVLFVDPETGMVQGTWGPRPDALQAAINETRAAYTPTEDAEVIAQRYEDLKVMIQKWYNADKTISIQQDFLKAMPNASIHE